MKGIYRHTATLYIRVYEPLPPPNEERAVWLRRVIPGVLLKQGSAGQRRLTVPVRPHDALVYRPPTWEPGAGFYTLPADERDGFWTVSAGAAPGGGDIVFHGVGPETGEVFRESEFLSQYADRAWRVGTVRDHSASGARVAHVAAAE